MSSRELSSTSRTVKSHSDGMTRTNNWSFSNFTTIQSQRRHHAEKASTMDSTIRKMSFTVREFFSFQRTSTFIMVTLKMIIWVDSVGSFMMRMAYSNQLKKDLEIIKSWKMNWDSGTSFSRKRAFGKAFTWTMKEKCSLIKIRSNTKHSLSINLMNFYAKNAKTQVMVQSKTSIVKDKCSFVKQWQEVTSNTSGPQKWTKKLEIRSRSFATSGSRLKTKSSNMSESTEKKLITGDRSNTSRTEEEFFMRIITISLISTLVILNKITMEITWSSQGVMDGKYHMKLISSPRKHTVIGAMKRIKMSFQTISKFLPNFNFAMVANLKVIH